MFFQINVTPKEKKKAEPIAKKIPEHNYNLLLAPFQPQTKIKLETKINTSIECKLNIRNSNQRSLTVSVTKTPPQERCISLNNTEWNISQESEVTLNILWEPQEAGTWRDVLQLSDSRHLYDVPLVLICIDPNKKAITKKDGKIKRTHSIGLKINNTKNLPKSISLSQKTTISNKSKKIDHQLKTQPGLKRTRCTTNEYPDKENISNNIHTNQILEQAKTKKYKKEQLSSPQPPPAPLDFSKFLNSSTFQFTPLKPNFANFEFDKKCTNLTFTPKYDNVTTNELFIKQEPSSISTENKVLTTLRKETYVTVPKYLNIEQNSNINDENDDKFDDSLSPRTPENKIGKPQSEISQLFDDIKLTPFQYPEITKTNGNNVKTKFSPNICSTGQKSNKTISPNDSSENMLNKNVTFDINNYEANNTYELPTSPIRAKNNLKPTCLAKSFIRNHLDNELSTPQVNNPLNMTNENGRFSNLFSKSQIDCGSVKDCLEADLWAKSKNVLVSPVSKSFLNSTLDSIVEENIINFNCSIEKESFNFDVNFDIHSKKSKALCIEISPPKKVINKKTFIRKVSPAKNNKVTKNKCTVETVSTKKINQINESIKNNKYIDIPGVQIAKLSLKRLRKDEDKSTSKPIKKPVKEVSVKLHDPNDFLMMYCNPDPFAATMIHDPFLANTLYYDDKWVFIQETEFKKWLNALLTPPEHLTADVESATIDIGKVWQSCRIKENVTLAETKESVSARYHTDTRLNTLRKAACLMFRKPEVISALSQTTVGIEKEIFVIRSDKDLHRDIGLQKIILELFLSYNPLWLRIGLETVYGETIPLQSNNDIIGLSKFLLNRFFSDPFLVKTHSSHAHPNIRLKTFQVHMNKFILKKFLFLVFFLDYAKRNKLIGHDPCLFHKKASYKDSRSILITFSREVLSGIGDITKVLRNYNYVVSHKQTYLDEYDYAVVNLSTDLRDGVRLCRVMELITGQKTLTSQCRVPAISRLQKVHNVDVALKTLNEAGYTITGNIEAKNIADGHKEKTLSLLWQIIHKFQAPRFEKAAKTLQSWWRSKRLYVNLKNFLKKRRHNAAFAIQGAWRCYVARKELQALKEEYARYMERKTKAARIIQLRWRLKKDMEIQRRHYQHVRLCIIKIQKFWRRILVTRPYIKKLKEQRQHMINVQRRWRATQVMKRQRNHFLKVRTSAIKIQTFWRARRLGKQVLKDYQNQRNAIIFVQRKWRAKLSMRKERRVFLQQLGAIKAIQEWWKRCLILKRDRNYFIALKNAVRTFEKVWIARNTVTEERKQFLADRNSIIVIQRAWRNYRGTKEYVQIYKKQINSCIKIQSWWRSVMAVKKYNKQRTSCIKMQRWYRGIILGRIERSRFLALKNATIVIQKNWRMQLTRKEFQRKKMSVLKIELWYKNLITTRITRNEYLKMKSAAKVIRNRWFALKAGRRARIQYSETRKAIITIQRKWRAHLLMRKVREEYLQLKHSAIKIQSYWKMILEKRRYKAHLKRVNAACVLQQRWRALKCGRQTRQMYIKNRCSVMFVQAKWRATRLARLERNEFLQKREAATVIQKYWRRFAAVREFRKKKNAVLLIEKWRRHVILGRLVRKEFLRLKENVKRLQQLLKVKAQVKEFRNQRNAAIKIQRFWRLVQNMRKCRAEYLKQKFAAITLQRRYRARKIGMQVRAEYEQRVAAIVRIQRWWRNILRARELKIFMENRRLAVVAIESWWVDAVEKRRIRRIKEAERRRKYNACAKIQAVWRGYKTRRVASNKLAILRERAKNAAKAAVPSATLASRLQENIEIFRYATNIGQLSVTLSSLDVITRLLPNACIKVCELNLVAKLYEILTQANRSLPWLDVCLKDISILLTLAKFKPTRVYVIKEEYIEVLARLLTISVDKKNDLFLHTATLIWVLTEEPEYVEAVKSCSRTKFLLNSLYSSINKKHSKNVSSVTKYKGDALPSPKPDWGLNHKRPRTFTNISQAITSIAERLNILNISYQAVDAQRSFNFSM